MTIADMLAREFPGVRFELTETEQPRAATITAWAPDVPQATRDAIQRRLATLTAGWDTEAAALATLRQTLAREIGTRLTTAPGKTFAQLTDREILHMLVRERFGALQNVGIFDANGVVQPLDRWRV